MVGDEDRVAGAEDGRARVITIARAFEFPIR